MGNWFEKFIQNLSNILLLPCYLIFIYVSPILLIISLVTKNFFNQIWIFFLYTLAGSVWRYIEKDMDHGIQKVVKEEKKDVARLYLISIYHLGNILLFIAFILILYYHKF